jgi:hypothetical protein
MITFPERQRQGNEGLQDLQTPPSGKCLVPVNCCKIELAPPRDGRSAFPPKKARCAYLNVSELLQLRQTFLQTFATQKLMHVFIFNYFSITYLKAIEPIR